MRIRGRTAGGGDGLTCVRSRVGPMGLSCLDGYERRYPYRGPNPYTVGGSDRSVPSSRRGGIGCGVGDVPVLATVGPSQSVQTKNCAAFGRRMSAACAGVNGGTLEQIRPNARDKQCIGYLRFSSLYRQYAQNEHEVSGPMRYMRGVRWAASIQARPISRAGRRAFRIGPPSPYKQMGKWWPRTESNCRHYDFQSYALPTELLGRPAAEIVVRRFTTISQSPRQITLPGPGSGCFTQLPSGRLGATFPPSASERRYPRRQLLVWVPPR
jgi:hypothetical protein